MAEKKGQDDKIQQLTQQLEVGIKEVFESERFKEYLKVMEKFHNYSYNNSMLIRLQNPEASYVAGYRVWQSLGRQVKKGEKAIYILAPCPYKQTIYDYVTNPKTGEVKTDSNGEPVKEKMEVTRVSFRATPIFDISQTEGEPLPELAKELTGEIPDYAILMDAIKAVAPVPIKFKPWSESKKGYYSLSNKEIVIKANMSKLQTIKTALHETAHSILHSDDKHIKNSATMEVEAESIAFVISQSMGLDTSDYSFSYLASWSSGKGLPELKNSLQIIQQTSHELIEQLEKQISQHTTITDISKEMTEPLSKVSSIADTFRHRR